MSNALSDLMTNLSAKVNEDVNNALEGLKANVKHLFLAIVGPDPESPEERTLEREDES